ncbi:fatty-acid amide hydrolase 2-A-like isoform X2 [Tubulanus polymorphus]
MITMNYIEDLLGYIVTAVGRVVSAILNLIFYLIYERQRSRVPPITNDILLQSATSLAKKIRTRELTSEQVVQAFIDRVEKVNPIINACIAECYNTALEEAKAVDEILDSGNLDESYSEEKKPFLGVPISVKTAFALNGMPFSSGLVSRKNVFADFDAPIVQNAKNCGAIPIVVTNCSELCMWWESANNIYGTTKNPYNTARIVGGSSGGEGAILAAGGAVLGIGSDIGGSIRMPSFFNGIFGHKPSKGIINNEGQFPMCDGKDVDYLTSGPMCRYADDLESWFNILAGSDISNLKSSGMVDVKKLKFYYMEDDGGCPVVKSLHPELRAAHRKVVEHIQSSLGIEVETINIKEMVHSLQIWSTLMSARLTGGSSFASLMGNGVEVNVWLELLKWTIGCSKHTFPAIGLGIMERFSGNDQEFNEKMIEMCDELKEKFQKLLSDDGILLYPTHPTPAPYHNQPITMMFNFAYTAIFNVLGLPATSCPLGLGSDGVPLGIQVIASHANDYNCFAVAREIEKAFGGWVKHI